MPATTPASPAPGLTEGRGAVVALVGNPNTGKTSLFNALTGYRRHVANYPGVTVERVSGPLRGAGGRVTVLDLPGTYSLTPQSPDEAIVRRACLEGAEGAEGQGPPDLLVAVVDAANLPRNLFLVSQLLELGRPVLVALNMVDIAERRGLRIDADRLSERLGVPVIPVVAVQDERVAELTAAILRELSASDSAPECAAPGLPAAPQMRPKGAALAAGRPPDESSGQPPDDGDERAADIRRRYAWISGVLEGVLRRPELPRTTATERLDRILMHRVGGPLILVAVLYVVFQAIFTWAGPLMDLVAAGFEWLAEWVGPLAPEGALRSFLTQGVIGGVGGVLIFLPQILILFFFLALLEDCGYLARAAFMSDRLMRIVGLSGRALFPLLSGYACAIPAILGARSIAEGRERFLTILLIPFMSCSARLPVYVLLIAAFVPPTTWLGGWLSLPALVMLAMYLVGAATAVPVALLLQRWAPPAGPSAFLLELPGYKMPRLRTVWQRMYFAGRSFVVRAGTIILLLNIVVWGLGYFPRSAETHAAVEAERAAASGTDHEWSAAQFETELAGAYLRDSFLGRLGHWLEPALRPLGWDWKIGIAVIASFPAREVIVATLGTIYNLGEGQDEASEPLREKLRAQRWPPGSGAREGQPIFTLPVALSIMVFFALCAQCASTLVTIGRELNSWVWPLVSFFGMTVLAYAAAWAVATVGRLLGG